MTSAMILTSQSGVPFLMEGDTVVPIDGMHIDQMVAMEFDRPGTLKDALTHVKAAVSIITGIDPSLPDDDWYGEFQAVLAVNEFIPIVGAISHARHSVREIEEANS